jgi:hypothetical protein
VKITLFGKTKKKQNKIKKHKEQQQLKICICSHFVLPFSRRFPPKGGIQAPPGPPWVLSCPSHERQNLLKPMKNTHFQ